jgi:lipopolysaccharide/colanic/teichoic acid biosynthesis glycosyltransferase
MSTASNTANRRDNHRLATEDAGQEPPRQDGITPRPYLRWKGLLDRCLAASLLVPGLPVIGLLVLLVRLTSRGPGIYRQARVGKNGHRFMMYKIRTMRQDAEATTGPVWTQPNDPRVTFLGKLLRKLHLDELPQLFNVLKGEMALIGPRPERPEIVRVLAEVIPGYRNRLAVLPGVTGLAQVNLPPDTDLLSVRRKLILDCQYIQNAGMWLDFRLFLCTVGRMFRISLVDILGLRRTVNLPDSADPSDDAVPTFGGPAALHVPHANGNNNGQSRPHAGDAARAHRKDEIRIRPR